MRFPKRETREEPAEGGPGGKEGEPRRLNYSVCQLWQRFQQLKTPPWLVVRTLGIFVLQKEKSGRVDL